jgi:hypothetical protein
MLCISTRSKCTVYRSPCSPSCPSLSSGGFAIAVTISLSEQISGNSNLNQNLWINSKFVKNWKKCQQKKCFKLDLLPPRFFPEFYSLLIYFSHTKNGFLGLIKIGIQPTRGAHLSAAVPGTSLWLAVMGGAGEHILCTHYLSCAYRVPQLVNIMKNSKKNYAYFLVILHLYINF